MTVQLSDAIREVLPSARADLERLVRIPSVSAMVTRGRRTTSVKLPDPSGCSTMVPVASSW
jgi:hypothetical protein